MTRLSGITKHGCTHNYIYILTIQTISVGPTKVDLNTHNFRSIFQLFPFNSEYNSI